MKVTAAGAEALIARHCASPFSAVLFDRASAELYDVGAHRRLPLDVRRLEAAEEKRNKETGRPYLALLRDDGRQLLLTEFGVAFEPVPVAGGSLDGLPPAVCLRDFAAALGRLDHLLDAHADAPAGREALDLVMLGVTILAGARGIGFDVTKEERDLEARLERIERARLATP